MTSQQLKNKKVIVITGISSGVGAAFVKLAGQNNNIYLIGIGRDRIEIKNTQGRYIKADLLVKSDMDKLTSIIKNEIGRVDVLINNAGIGYKGTIEDLSISDINKQFQINFISPICLIKSVLPLMRKQNSGQIINICSIGAYTQTPTFGYYAISKNMLLSASEILREEVRPWNIKINVLIPGAVKSKFGKNIINFQEESIYKKLYNEWNNRFEYYFKNHCSSNHIARQLWRLIEKPQDKLICSLREKFIIFCSKILNNRHNNYLLKNFIYKEKI